MSIDANPLEFRSRPLGLRRVVASAVLALLAAGFGGPRLHAQEAEPEVEDDSVVDVITVTARRAVENVQDVPVPITVISEDELETKRIVNVREVKKVVPNIVFERNTGTSSGAKVFLRGVGTDESLFTAEPAVGIYVDDIYIPRQTGAAFDLYDLERVEVLRGPQGTLYGRNTSGGAIKLYSRKPSAERAIRGKFGGGSDSEIDANFYFGGGTESVAGSIALLKKQRDGYSLDLVNGREVNDQDLFAARGQLQFSLSDNDELRIAIDNSTEDSTAGFASSLLFNDDNDIYTLESGLNDMNDLDQGGISVRYTRTADDWQFASVTGYREMDNLLLLDADGTPIARFHLFQDQEQEQLSQEFQLFSTGGGDFSWQAGALYFEEDNSQPTQNIIFAPGNINNIGQETTSYGGYGQVNYRKGDLLLTGGLRYSSEEKDFRVVSTSAMGAPNFVFNANDDWNSVDYRAEVAYRFSEQVMGYLTTATGFKSGGFNGRGGNPAALGSFDEEEVTNYEIGVKTDLANRRVRLNANYYFNQYDGLQFSTLDDVGVFRTINAADTEIQGFEVDLRAVLAPRLDLTINLGTIDDEFKESVPTFNTTDLELKQAPDVSWGLGLSYTALFGTNGSAGYLSMAADTNYVDDHFQNVANSALIATDNYQLVNVRMAYGPSSGRWELYLYGNNITDEEYSAGGFDIGVLGIGVIYANRPANYGGGVSFRF